MRSSGAAAGTIVEKNIAVPMSDGVTLRVNVFRPDHVAPVVMSRFPPRTRRDTQPARTAVPRPPHRRAHRPR
jgi:predicted acyl esterase